MRVGTKIDHLYAQLTKQRRVFEKNVLFCTHFVGLRRWQNHHSLNITYEHPLFKMWAGTFCIPVWIISLKLVAICDETDGEDNANHLQIKLVQPLIAFHHFFFLFSFLFICLFLSSVFFLYWNLNASLGIFDKKLKVFLSKFLKWQKNQMLKCPGYCRNIHSLVLMLFCK